VSMSHVIVHVMVTMRIEKNSPIGESTRMLLALVSGLSMGPDLAVDAVVSPLVSC
jgi:hypothetical protein